MDHEPTLIRADRDPLPATIAPAGPAEMGEALALVEALLAELGDEGQEFAQIDRSKLEQDLSEASLSGRFLALLARDPSGTAIGVLTLSASFAVYAGGEYGVIDEMYVAPEWRGRGVGTGLVEAAVRIARERRWFRLDVTGPNGAPDAGGAARACDLGAGRGGGAAREPDGADMRRPGLTVVDPSGGPLRLVESDKSPRWRTGSCVVGAESRDAPADGACEAAAGAPSASAAEPDGAVRFYRRLGFEPTGQKLRLLV